MNIEMEFLEDLISEGNIVKWKHKKKCAYICSEEIFLISEKCSMSDGSINLFYNLGRGVVNCFNILCDKQGMPLNQVDICKQFGIKQRTFSRNISELIDAKMIYKVSTNKDVYYIINPYLIHSGEVSEIISALFDSIGYNRQCDFNLELTDSEIRWSQEYRNWRDSVREKYSYKCVISENLNKKDDKIKIHHLNGFNWDIKNRFNVDNGVCLSSSIHDEFHQIYGNGNNTREQFEEFYFNKTGKLFTQ